MQSRGLAEGQGKSDGKCSSSSLRGDHLVGGPGVCLICLLGMGREHLSSEEGNHMYFTYVGDPQLSHGEPPHAVAGLQRCINFLKQPVNSKAALGCKLARGIFRCNPRRSPDGVQTLSLSSWRTAKPSDARPGRPPWGRRAEKLMCSSEPRCL